MKFAVMMAGLLLGRAALWSAVVSSVDPDQTIVFTPAPARLVAGGTAVEATIRGVVYELETRRFTLGLLQESLGLAGTELTPDQVRVFKERGRLFLVDHERRERVVIRLGDQTFDLGRTRSDGWFSRKVTYRLPHDAGAPRRLDFTAVLRDADPRVLGSRCLVMPVGALVVVSDIDDTIKETGVGERSRMLKNTFLEPYRPVPGMADLYGRLAARGAFFHYLSASPWQLYNPLSDFCRSNGFPDGIFHLKPFRFKDRSFLSLFQDPEKYKIPILEQLLREAPDSHFILVGDAGEKDPEIYVGLARKYPGQIKKILIRTSEPPGARYERLAHGLPTGCLVFFADPARAYPDLLPELGQPAPRF